MSKSCLKHQQGLIKAMSMSHLTSFSQQVGVTMEIGFLIPKKKKKHRKPVGNRPITLKQVNPGWVIAINQFICFPVGLHKSSSPGSETGEIPHGL